ncbi:MAG: DegV family protein [Lachnospiraceae bacterium]|nr:DegV family protein [Lachnospiraceae bacterium]
MDNYTLITDVTCDLDDRTYEDLGVVCIPMGFLFGDSEYMHYPDEREMSIKTFYERLENGEMPKTAQINPLVYREYFEKSLKAGKDVLCLSFSSGLSGSTSTAFMVARELEEQYPERTIRVIDTLCASVGEGSVILQAARAKRAGATLEELADKVQDDIAHCCQWFTVDNLMHLKRGGRLNSFEAIVGSALKIQPVLTIDPEGKLTVVSKERGTKNALAYLMRRLREDAADANSQTILIAHADCPEKAEMLRSMVNAEYPGAEVLVYKIGPIIGAHVGNGMCAMVFGGARPGFGK